MNANDDDALTPIFDEKLDLNLNENLLPSPAEPPVMITNLDDLLIDGQDDQEENDLKHSSSFLLDNKFRRPIQEDILYEVEHENSLSETSQHAPSIIKLDEMVRINLIFLLLCHLIQL